MNPIENLKIGFIGLGYAGLPTACLLAEKYPLIGEALRDILECGADWADMSGSGATVFGVFESESRAKQAALKCQKKWKCVLAH